MIKNYIVKKYKWASNNPKAWGWLQWIDGLATGLLLWFLFG